MSDDLIPKFLQKLSELEKFVKQNENDRSKIIAKIVKLQSWLVGDRSLVQHRMLQAYFTFLYNSYGDDFTSRDDFIDWIKYQVGYCKVKITETTIKGERVVFKKFKPQSLSFTRCSQKMHNDITQKVQEFAQVKWDIVFDDWYKQWSENENTVQ